MFTLLAFAPSLYYLVLAHDLIEKLCPFSEDQPLARVWGEIMTQAASVTAAVLVIGDEILSGRTKDQNISYIADYLSKIGIDLHEARVVPDVTAEIVAAVNALRQRYDYLFTTGGIGPTHGAHSAWRRACAEQNIDCPRLLDCQCHRDGRCSRGHASHARRCRAEA